MTYVFLQITIFVTVLFIYVHLHAHLKTNNRLEIYDAGVSSHTQLTESCDIRQPFVFYSPFSPKVAPLINELNLSNTYSANVYVKPTVSSETPILIQSSFSRLPDIINSDSKYYSCHNTDTINNNIDLLSAISFPNYMLKPTGPVYTIRDLFIGGNNGTTPFKYEINSRTFLTAYNSPINIILSPPNSIDELCPRYDYELFEFTSEHNPWAQTKNEPKIQTSIIEVLPGQSLFIPPYWWYSIQFNDAITQVGFVGYQSISSSLSVLPYFIMRCFQLQNVIQLPLMNKAPRPTPK
jgi:hypothetical protein